jgi:bacterioferritin
MNEKIITRDQPMDSDMAAYHVNKPYPVPVNLPRNPQQGALLSLAYAGRDSEMTALSQYVVHHETCSDTDPQISKDILQIGIIEMFHLDMLGSCMKQLGVGVNLAVQNGRSLQFWSTQNIKYGCNLRDRIAIDIQSEAACIAQYQQIIRRMPNDAINALLQRIIDDEELHIKLFENMLTKI